MFVEMKRLIERLDAQPPQVVIQVLIADVQLTNNRDIGIEFGIQSPVLFNRGGLASPGFNFNSTAPLGSVNASEQGNVGFQGLSNLGVGRVGSSGFGGFVFSASSQSFNLLIRAMAAQSRVDILSRPQVQVMDNQEGFIQVGQDFPYPTNVNVTGLTTQQGVAYRQIGVVMRVTPRITPDGKVIMRIEPQISSVSPTAVSLGNGFSAPAFNIQTVQTTVLASDGETIVLGGLITKQDNRTENGWPIFKDIPYVGALFRFRSQQIHEARSAHHHDAAHHAERSRSGPHPRRRVVEDELVPGRRGPRPRPRHGSDGPGGARRAGHADQPERAARRLLPTGPSVLRKYRARSGCGCEPRAVAQPQPGMLPPQAQPYYPGVTGPIMPNMPPGMAPAPGAGTLPPASAVPGPVPAQPQPAASVPIRRDAEHASHHAGSDDSRPARYWRDNARRSGVRDSTVRWADGADGAAHDAHDAAGHGPHLSDGDAAAVATGAGRERNPGGPDRSPKHRGQGGPLAMGRLRSIIAARAVRRDRGAGNGLLRRRLLEAQVRMESAGDERADAGRLAQRQRRGRRPGQRLVAFRRSADRASPARSQER